MQIGLLASVIATLAFALEAFAPYVQMLIVGVALATVVSGTEYTVDWWRRMNKLEQG